MIRAVPPSSVSEPRAGDGSGGGRRGAEVVRGRRGRDDEPEVAAAQPDVDGAGGQLAGDLLGGGGEGAEQRETQRGLQRGGEPLRERARLVAADLGGGHELAAQLLDVGGEVHDVIVTSL